MSLTLGLVGASQARYLKFCQDYNPNACCIPGHDLENQVQFENMIDGLGPGCKNPMMYPEIRYFYCLGCDPDQPDYTNSPKMEITVCKSFVDKLWDDPAYEECGVMRGNECPPEMADFDPFQCGDDLVLPKNDFTSGIDFMNAYPPPGLGDFSFVEYDDGDDDNAAREGRCWTAPAFRNSSSGSAPRVSYWVAAAAVLIGLSLGRLL